MARFGLNGNWEEINNGAALVQVQGIGKVFLKWAASLPAASEASYIVREDGETLTYTGTDKLYARAASPKANRVAVVVEV